MPVCTTKMVPYTVTTKVPYKVTECVPCVECKRVPVCKEYEVHLEVDTKKVHLPGVISHVLRAGRVADIAIEDPPLDHVIARIYGGIGNCAESRLAGKEDP